MKITQNTKSFIILILCLITLNTYAETEPNTFRFGAIVPLSNDFAASGNYIKRGIEKAAIDLKEEGINIDVFYEDACVPTKALPAAQKLITIHDIDALVSNFCVIALPALKSILERNKVITIQSSVVPKAFLKENRYLFSSFPSAHVEALALAKYALKSLGVRKAAILHLATPWGEEYADFFTKHFKALGGHLLCVNQNTDVFWRN